MTTDVNGSFHIEHPGAVMRFSPGDRFQPQSISVDSKMPPLNVVLEPASNSLLLPPCGKPKPGFERIGFGQFGPQFDVSRHDARFYRGKVDTDYVVHIVKAKQGNDRLRQQ